MALLFIDGFDHYATADIGKKWDIASGTIYPASGRRGTGAWGGANGSRITKSIPASPTVIVGFSWFAPNISNGQSFTNAMCHFADAGNTHILLLPRQDNALVVYREAGSLVQLGASIAGVLLLNAWNYIEMKATIHDTLGAVEVRCNGVTVINVSNVDTRNAASAQTSQVRFGGAINTNDISYLDDLYVCNSTGATNNDFLGDVRVESLLPNADGTYSQFTPSTGTTHYTLVDESTPNTSDYVDGINVGDKDSYAMTNLTPIASQTIFGVQVNAAVAKDDAGSKSVATLLRSGGVDSSGSPVALTITQKYASQVYETNPNGAAAWTEAAVNAVEAGVVVTA